MKKTKIKEIIKVMTVSALSIALFSAAFMGANHVALTAATNGTQTLPPAETIITIPDNLPPVGFIAPQLIVRETSWHNYAAKPAYALSAEEAAQMGAQYIWDIFGESIDGKYVSMSFVAWPGHQRIQWHGMVTLSPHDEAGGIRSNMRFMFLLDAVTGERIDIMYMGHQTTRAPIDTEDAENHPSRRAMMALRMMGEEGWLKMVDAGNTILESLPPEQLEMYVNRATELAQRHFNNSTVVDVRLGNEWSEGTRIGITFDEDENFVFYLDGLEFTATDDTGRTAFITIPAAEATFTFINITTQHNDRIPGWCYSIYNPEGYARGRG